MRRLFRRRSLGRVASSLAGLALAPTAMGTLLAAAAALGSLARHSESTSWFLVGFGAYAAGHLSGAWRLRRAYVLAHELTHALAAVSSGAKVLSLSVRKESGHVDLSRVSAFSALAPYWLPLYALLLVVAYRVVLWLGAPPRSQECFVLLMGASLSFHLCHTVESLWTQHQSDLDHAGLFLSLSAIVLLNSLLVLVAVKCLFPRLVSLAGAARSVRGFTAAFWGEVARPIERRVLALRGTRG